MFYSRPSLMDAVKRLQLGHNVCKISVLGGVCSVYAVYY